MPHIVPLAPQVVAILKDLYPLTSHSLYVFPNVWESGRSINKNALCVALRIVGIEPDEMTAHGFRAVARTLLDEVL